MDPTTWWILGAIGLLFLSRRGAPGASTFVGTGRPSTGAATVGTRAPTIVIDLGSLFKGGPSNTPTGKPSTGGLSGGGFSGGPSSPGQPDPGRTLSTPDTPFDRGGNFTGPSTINREPFDLTDNAIPMDELIGVDPGDPTPTDQAFNDNSGTAGFGPDDEGVDLGNDYF